MSTLLSVELPEEIMNFVREEAAAKGLGEAQAYVIELLRNERIRRIREQIADAIDEGLRSESRAMTAEDWERYRAIARGQNPGGERS